MDVADKQLVQSIKPLLCQVYGTFSESSIEKISYTVYLTDPQIYHAGTLESAEAALLKFGEKWNGKYPAIYALWERNWANIVTIFGYSAEIRKVIYTRNRVAQRSKPKANKDEEDTRER